MDNKLIIIAGPTGVGKTKLSIELAKSLNGEIISCDSMQIYKHMDIGSAKITKEEAEGIRHHLIDIIEPNEEFSVADYQKLAKEAIDDIKGRKKFPIMVGGTGLYINSIVRKFNFTQSEKDDSIRLKYQRICDEKGNDYLHELLKEVDIESYHAIHKNNVKRVIRALEVFERTNIPYSKQKVGNEINDLYKAYYYYLNMNRDLLYENINKRVDIMMEKGLLDEVKKLASMGLSKNHQSMQGIGYKELISYLDGKCSLEEAIKDIKQLSRNYAKRQITWFKNDLLTKELNKDIMSLDKMLLYIRKDIEI